MVAFRGRGISDGESPNAQSIDHAKVDEDTDDRVDPPQPEREPGPVLAPRRDASDGDHVLSISSDPCNAFTRRLTTIVAKPMGMQPQNSPLTGCRSVALNSPRQYAYRTILPAAMRVKSTMLSTKTTSPSRSSQRAEYGKVRRRMDVMPVPMVMLKKDGARCRVRRATRG